MQLHLDEIATKITPGAHAIRRPDKTSIVPQQPPRFDL